MKKILHLEAGVSLGESQEDRSLLTQKANVTINSQNTKLATRKGLAAAWREHVAVQ